MRLEEAIEYVGSVINKAKKAGFYNVYKRKGVISNVYILDGYMQITNGYILIKSEIETDLPDDKFVQIKYDLGNDTYTYEVCDKTDEEVKRLRILENILAYYKEPLREDNILGLEYFPFYQEAKNHIGKKKGYYKTAFIGDEGDDSVLLVDNINMVASLAKKIGLALNKATNYKVYSGMYLFNIGTTQIAIAKNDITHKGSYRGEVDLVLTKEKTFISEKAKEEIGDYTPGTANSKYVFPQDDEILIKNIKHLNKEVYYGETILDLIMRVRDIKEGFLRYIKVSKAVTDELETLIVELNNIPLSETNVRFRFA